MHSSSKSCFFLRFPLKLPLNAGVTSVYELLNCILFSAWKDGFQSLCADIFHDVRMVSTRLSVFGVPGQRRA